MARTASWTGLPSMIAPGGARVADPPGVVELERRRESGKARGDHLRSAAEAGEEVRFHESGRDPDVGIHPLAGEEDGHVADHPEVDETRIVAGVVIDDTPRAQDLVTQHLPPLVGGRRPMGPGRDEDDHVLRPDDAVDGLHDRLEHHGARLGAGDVADRDRDTLSASDDVAQGRTSDRLPDGRREDGPRIVDRRAVPRDDDGRRPGRQMDRERSRSIRKIDVDRVQPVAHPLIRRRRSLTSSRGRRHRRTCPIRGRSAIHPTRGRERRPPRPPAARGRRSVAAS